MIVLQMWIVATGLIYGGALGWLLWGLRRAAAAVLEETPRVSVIVAARNEEAHIGACLDALRAQDYAGEYEIIVVDDRSRDGTRQRVACHAAADPRIRLVSAPEKLRFRCPKKSALAWGIQHSLSDILLFTDADCFPATGWMRAMVARFGPDVGLVAGYARPKPGTRVRQKLLALDNLAVGALGAGSFGMGRPLSCTGRNLAYRRALYDELGGFAASGHLIGGDDVYLTRAAAQRTNWRLVFTRDADAVVPCAPPPARWGDILHQKLRHAGKAGHYGRGALLLGISVYFFHAALGIASGAALLGASVQEVTIAVWSVKMVLDGLLVGAMATPGERYLLLFLPLLEVLYIPYVVLFTVIGRMGWFRWKPRIERRDS